VDGARDVFGRIYATDHWQGGSGEGSTLDAAQPYLRLLRRTLDVLRPRKVVDIGCGDWQFSRLVEWPNRYVGIDVVPEVIAQNHTYQNRKIKFRCGDVRSAQLPRASLYIVKDVLQHWPNDDVTAFLARLRAPALVTNDVWSAHDHPGVNADVPLGHWRPLDLAAGPFNVTAAWSEDWDIRGEWTKRTMLIER
jgi:SAM-dependent methyltransferase